MNFDSVLRVARIGGRSAIANFQFCCGKAGEYLIDFIKLSTVETVETTNIQTTDNSPMFSRKIKLVMSVYAKDVKIDKNDLLFEFHQSIYHQTVLLIGNVIYENVRDVVWRNSYE